MKALTLVLVGLLLTALVVELLLVSPHPARILRFQRTVVPSSNGLPMVYTVCVSNTSQYPLLCDFMGDFKSPWFKILYLSNGVWYNNEQWYESIDIAKWGGSGVLTALGGGSANVKVPDGATKFKVGLDVTVLTWRGRIGWKLLNSRFGRVLKSLSVYLVKSDMTNQSRTEWSEEYSLDAYTPYNSITPKYVPQALPGSNK